MPYSLKSRNALVVAGSRGLGACIATKLAKEGANVAITYIGNEARAKETAGACEKHGVKTLVLQADGGKAEDMVRIVKETRDGLGGLDVIIGNQVGFLVWSAWIAKPVLRNTMNDISDKHLQGLHRVHHLWRIGCHV